MGNASSALTERCPSSCSPNSSRWAPSPSGTTDRMFLPKKRKMRGLRSPAAGWALMTLRVAWIASGRSRADRKHGSVTGRGSAFSSATVSEMLSGELETPSGATHRGDADPDEPALGSLQPMAPPPPRTAPPLRSNAPRTPAERRLPARAVPRDGVPRAGLSWDGPPRDGAPPGGARRDGAIRAVVMGGEDDDEADGSGAGRGGADGRAPAGPWAGRAGQPKARSMRSSIARPSPRGPHPSPVPRRTRTPADLRTPPAPGGRRRGPTDAGPSSGPGRRL